MKYTFDSTTPFLEESDAFCRLQNGAEEIETRNRFLYPINMHWMHEVHAFARKSLSRGPTPGCIKRVPAKLWGAASGWRKRDRRTGLVRLGGQLPDIPHKLCPLQPSSAESQFVPMFVSGEFRPAQHKQKLDYRYLIFMRL